MQIVNGFFLKKGDIGVPAIACMRVRQKRMGSIEDTL